MDPAVPALVLVAYLVGSFPTARVVARRSGHDPTREGSGNPGASNVYRVVGRTAGMVVFAVDVLKGAMATGGAWAVAAASITGAEPRLLAMAAGAAAVAGHTMPPWGGRGGKGVATTAGMMAVLFPLVAVVLLGVWLAIVKIADKASLASLVVAVGAPAAVAVSGAPGSEVGVVVVVALYVVARHASNILRLVRGEERSLHSGA